MLETPEALGHDDEMLVIEPVTWLDGSPVTQTRRLRVTELGAALGLPGIVALAEGLALLCCFSLPWFSILQVTFAEGPDGGADLTPSPKSFSGWSIAQSAPFGPEEWAHVALFVHLWLVPITACALLTIAWLCAQSRVAPRLAAGATLALSVLVLLIAIGYAVQVTSLAAASVFPGGLGAPLVSWGCWAAMAASAAALVASANILRPPRTSLSDDADFEVEAGSTLGGAASAGA